MPYQKNLLLQHAKSPAPAQKKDQSFQEFLQLANQSFRKQAPGPHSLLSTADERESNEFLVELDELTRSNRMTAQKIIDLRQFINNIKFFNYAKAEEAGNTIRLIIDESLPRYITGDDVRLYQFLNKLVSNAVQFTRHGTITVSMQVRSKTAQHVTVDFYVSDVHTGSRPGQASTFYFILTFGISENTPYHELARYDVTKDLCGARILLVEDVEYNYMIAEKILTGWNACVDIAQNGVEAISLARKNSYDVVLMDLQMPVMDGYLATKHIRYFNESIPIIALTAYAGREILHTTDCGFTDFLAKPFNPADLFDMVENYVKKKQVG